MTSMTKPRRLFLRGLAAFLLICMGIAALSSCGRKYRPVPSTDNDLRIVMVIDGFEVPYEQYRYFFLKYKEAYENGDPAVWDGPQGASLETEVQNAAISALKGEYAILSLCKKYGIAISDAAIQEYVQQYVAETIDEHGGREKYLKALTGQYLNDSTFRFLLGVDKCEEMLYNLLTADQSIIPSDDEIVTAYLNSDNMIRVVHVFIQNDEGDDIETNRALASEVLQKARAGENFDNLIRDYSEDFLMTPDGYYITPFEMIEAFEKAAYSLSINEVSDVVETHLGFHVIKRLSKSSSYISKHFGDLKEKYLQSAFYTIVEGKKETLSPVFTEFYQTLNNKTVQ